MIHLATLAALGGQSFEWLVLVRFDLDEGALAFSNQFDTLTFDGVEYMPFGTLGDISSITENLDLSPQWMDVSLSGIQADVLEAALNTNFFNKRAFVHLGVVGESGIIGEPFLYFSGRIDSMDCEYGETSAITVKCADEL